MGVAHWNSAAGELSISRPTAEVVALTGFLTVDGVTLLATAELEGMLLKVRHSSVTTSTGEQASPVAHAAAVQLIQQEAERWRTGLAGAMRGISVATGRQAVVELLREWHEAGALPRRRELLACWDGHSTDATAPLAELLEQIANRGLSDLLEELHMIVQPLPG